MQVAVPDLTLLVCCHAARDSRCGAVGPPLVAALRRLARHAGVEGHVQVLATSHVGGHKVRRRRRWRGGRLRLLGAGAAITQVAPAPTPPPCTVLQYAGNVLVYGGRHPCDGDWFGGVSAANAAAFLDALLSVEVSALASCPLAGGLPRTGWPVPRSCRLPTCDPQRPPCQCPAAGGRRRRGGSGAAAAVAGTHGSQQARAAGAL